ncbi:MAG: DUF3237 family protein [Parvibaculaceae bacterium]
MTPAPLQTEFVLEAYVTIGVPVKVGASKDGYRQMIPITGGQFEGPRIEGKVMAGGGDWQRMRPDGVMMVEAHYIIETDDGAKIVVRNNGIGVASPDGGEPYVRTVPEFEASKGPHEWLNTSLFVGSISRPIDGSSAVIIRVFRVA